MQANQKTRLFCIEYINEEDEFWVFLLSSSARRTWIEILNAHRAAGTKPSSSARRTWIEIVLIHAQLLVCPVVLRKEDVD